MCKKIGDYGIIGNLQSVALVGRDASIDWLCLPHIDSPSVFAAILDANDGGFFSITPEGEWDSVVNYREDSNVLVGKCGGVASGNGEQVTLCTGRDLKIVDGVNAEGVWDLEEGERVALCLRYGGEPEQVPEEQAEGHLVGTLKFWRDYA